MADQPDTLKHFVNNLHFGHNLGPDSSNIDELILVQFMMKLVNFRTLSTDACFDHDNGAIVYKVVKDLFTNWA